MKIEIKGIKRYPDGHGKLRVYHRKSGEKIDPTLEGAALAAEVDRLNRKYEAPKPKAGTLGGMFASYRAAPRYTELAPRTKQDYSGIMDYLMRIDQMPLVSMTPEFMAKLRDKIFRVK